MGGRTPSPWSKDQPIEFGKSMTTEQEKRGHEGLAAGLLAKEAQELREAGYKPEEFGDLSKNPDWQLANLIFDRLERRGSAEYRAYVRYPKDKSGFVCIGTIIGGTYSWNPEGYTIWLDAWERDVKWPRSSLLGIRPSKRFGPVGFKATRAGPMDALKYINQAFPDYTEAMWVRSSIPADVAVEVGVLSIGA